MSKGKKGIAAKLGTGLAHVQSFVDDVLEMGFKGLKSVSRKHKDEEIETDTVPGKIKYGMKKTAGFLGEMGETFYDKYEEIKADKKKRK